MCKFSICIPAFKSTFFKECIDSVLNQTFVDYEIIILNDNSPEPIDTIISSLKDNKIKYHKNETNTGAENLVDNWNKCLNLAKGDFIIIMGDDDCIEQNYLEEFNNLIDKYPYLDVYHCRSQIIDENSNLLELTPSLPEFETVYGNILHRVKMYRVQFISDFVYRVNTLKALGGFVKLPLAWASDDITSYKISTEKGIAHTNKPVFKYRKNTISITSTGKSMLKMEALMLEIKWLENFLTVKTYDKFELAELSQIRKRIPNYIRFRKVQTMADSYNGYVIRNIKYWILYRKKFNIEIYLIIYSMFYCIKKKFLS